MADLLTWVLLFKTLGLILLLAALVIGFAFWHNADTPELLGFYGTSLLYFAPGFIAGMFDSSDDARRKLVRWRYDYNHVRPHSSLGNKTPVEARRTLEQFEGSAPDALAQTGNEEYENQTGRLSL